jgi:hypothetical protein
VTDAARSLFLATALVFIHALVDDFGYDERAMFNRGMPRWRLALAVVLPFATMTGMIAIYDRPEFNSVGLIPLYFAASVSVVVFLVFRRWLR